MTDVLFPIDRLRPARMRAGPAFPIDRRTDLEWRPNTPMGRAGQASIRLIGGPSVDQEPYLTLEDSRKRGYRVKPVDNPGSRNDFRELPSSRVPVRPRVRTCSAVGPFPIDRRYRRIGKAFPIDRAGGEAFDSYPGSLEARVRLGTRAKRLKTNDFAGDSCGAPSGSAVARHRLRLINRRSIGNGRTSADVFRESPVLDSARRVAGMIQCQS